MIIQKPGGDYPPDREAADKKRLRLIAPSEGGESSCCFAASGPAYTLWSNNMTAENIQQRIDEERLTQDGHTFVPGEHTQSMRIWQMYTKHVDFARPGVFRKFLRRLRAILRAVVRTANVVM
jgi:hypothetical protein